MSQQKAAWKLYERASDVSLEDLLDHAEKNEEVPVAINTTDPDIIRRSHGVLQDFRSQIRRDLEQKENHARIAKNVAQAMQIEKEKEQEKRREKENEIEYLKKELKKETRAKNNTFKTVEDQKKEVQTLQHHLTQTKIQLSAKERRSNQMTNENSELKKKVKNLENKVEGLENEVEGLENKTQRFEQEVFELRSTALKIEIGNLLSSFIMRCGGDFVHPGRVIKNLDDQEEDVREKMLKHFSRKELHQYYVHIYKKRTTDAHYVPSGASLQNLAAEAEKKNLFKKNKIQLIAKMTKVLEEEDDDDDDESEEESDEEDIK